MWEIEVGIPSIKKLVIIASDNGVKIVVLNGSREEMDVRHFMKIIHHIRERLDKIVVDLTQAMREAGVIMLSEEQPHQS